MRVDDNVILDLALAYVALVRDADAAAGTHPDDETDAVEIVAPRLGKLCERESADVAASVEKAAEMLDAPGGNSLLLNAVQSIRDQVAMDDRVRIVEDLIQLALVDNRYVHEEARLIGAIARAWDVHPSPTSEEATRMWSVLDPRGGSGRRSPVHNLALLYLAMAHESDSELAQEEMDTITRKLGEWLPASLPSDVLNVVAEALEEYSAGADAARLDGALASIRDSVPEHQRRAVLSDLMHVARADRVVLVEERAMISKLAEQWQIEVPDIGPTTNRGSA